MLCIESINSSILIEKLPMSSSAFKFKKKNNLIKEMIGLRLQAKNQHLYSRWKGKTTNLKDHSQYPEPLQGTRKEKKKKETQIIHKKDREIILRIEEETIQLEEIMEKGMKYIKDDIHQRGNMKQDIAILSNQIKIHIRINQE